MLLRLCTALTLLVPASYLFAQIETLDSATRSAGGEMAGKSESTAKKQPAETSPLALAQNHLQVLVPKSWKQVKPRNRIIEVEIAVALEDQGEDSPPPARLTVMASGGSIKANLARWVGQFRPADDEPKIDEKQVNGMKLTTFDASGTYLDSPRGPFGPKEEKPGYRMLAGILQTDEVGNYFFKLVGPAEVVQNNADWFLDMLATAEKTP